MSRNRLVAYVLGAVYLLVGIVGFAINRNFGDKNTGDKLLGLFEINGLHNVVHILIGVALLAAARAGYRAARSMNMAVGGVYLLVGILGLFIANDHSAANILSLNGADNVLHIGSALVLLAVALSEKDYVEVDRERDRASMA
ncbi:MAG: hypothetical protein QOG49_935 [Frankiaceae bacterium]|nr:hypothetical protein [Frankiaceae bacterium]